MQFVTTLVRNGTLKSINYIFEFIETNIERGVSIQTLAEEMEMSQWPLQRMFRAIVGRSLGSYIRGRRLTLAATHLESETRIIDIALAVGFNSHESFTRSFKAYFGLTPEQFRTRNFPILKNRLPQVDSKQLDFARSDISIEPEIVKLPATKVLGFAAQVRSPFSSVPEYCNDIFPVWKRVSTLAKIVLKKEFNEYIGLAISSSGDYDERTVTFFGGVTNPPSDHVPDGSEIVTIDPGTYALFDTADISEDAMANTIVHIYAYWLERSAYRRRAGNDFELFAGQLNLNDTESGHLQGRYAIPIESV